MPKSVFDGYLTDSCKECESWSDGYDGRPLGCCTCFPIMHCDAFREMYEKEMKQSKRRQYENNGNIRT